MYRFGISTGALVPRHLSNLLPVRGTWIAYLLRYSLELPSRPVSTKGSANGVRFRKGIGERQEFEGPKLRQRCGNNGSSAIGRHGASTHLDPRNFP